jgi:hypothetical protein
VASLFFLHTSHFLSADFRSSQSDSRSGAAVLLMQLMQVGWLGDENGDWAELRFGFGSSNQVQGTVLFAPRSSTEASDVDGV